LFVWHPRPRIFSRVLSQAHPIIGKWGNFWRNPPSHEDNLVFVKGICRLCAIFGSSAAKPGTTRRPQRRAAWKRRLAEG
jgi:hypothetical protein